MAARIVGFVVAQPWAGARRLQAFLSDSYRFPLSSSDDAQPRVGGEHDRHGRLRTQGVARRYWPIGWSSSFMGIFNHGNIQHENAL